MRSEHKTDAIIIKKIYSRQRNGTSIKILYFYPYFYSLVSIYQSKIKTNTKIATIIKTFLI